MSTIVSTVEDPTGLDTTHTVAVTVSGSDTAVFALVRVSFVTISSVTCDGNAMSLVASLTDGFSGTIALYSRVGVATGTRNVVVTLSGGEVIGLIVQSRSGVNQTTPTRTPTTAALSFTTSLSQSVASASGEDVLSLLALLRTAAAFTPTAPTTTTLTQSFIDSGEGRLLALNTVATGSSQTVAGSATGGDGMIGYIGVGIQDAGGGAAAPFTTSLESSVILLPSKLTVPYLPAVQQAATF